MKHTPGPWHVGPHYKHDVESREGRICECVPMGSERAENNARLVAAAPDLLEALKDATKALEMAYRIATADLYKTKAELDEAIGQHLTITKARAAVAKAEGR